MAKRKAEWQNRYIEKVYDRINLLVDKGNKDIIKARAEQLGESVNAYINRLISEDLERSSTQDAP
jgi:predicted HicB family RNase H-like nuclease